MERHRRALVGVTAGRGARARPPSTTCSTPSRSAPTWWRCAPTSPACSAARSSCSSTPSDARRPRRRHHGRRRVHPRGGRVPGRLRPDALRAGQPPLRRRADARELRRAGRRPPRRRPSPTTIPPHGTLVRVRRSGGLQADPAAIVGERAAAAEAQARRRRRGRRRGERPDGHHRRPQDRHRRASATTTPTPWSATWPPAATRGCARP